jgi:hypothetical protein
VTDILRPAYYDKLRPAIRKQQLMHRLDIALFEASLEPEDPPGF